MGMDDPHSPNRSASPPMARELERLVTRAAELAPGSLNEAARTVEVVWTTGAKVLRGFFDQYFEELSLDPAHVRMDRLGSGRAPLLDSHRAVGVAAVIGVVESARIEKGRGLATVRFAKDDPAADAAWNKVKQGIVRSVSVGYQVHKLEKVEGGDAEIPTYRATDWTPFEISAVPMGADAEAHFRAQELNMEPKIVAEKPSPEATKERERSTSILGLVRRAKLDQSVAEELIGSGVTPDQARVEVLDRLATRDEARPIHSQIREMSLDGDEDRGRSVRGMSEALASRYGGPAPSDEARQYLRLSARDMARACLEKRGVSTRLLSDGQIIARALHTTSDFPELLTGTGNRFLRQGYASYQGGVRRICRESTAPDFRAKVKLSLGEAPDLELVAEGGEFKRGSMSESKQSYSLSTFGKVFSISRQALINDDLGAFTELAAKLGRASAEFEAGQLVSLLTSNPVMSDSIALFHASHGNLIGTGSVIATASLTEALKLMRLQKGLDGKTPIDATPKFLVVPAALEIVAKQYLTQISPATASAVNPFTGSLELVVDPRLDAKSATAWYLAADPTLLDTIEYSHLDGEPGPQIESRAGFDVDGVEMRVRLDFGAGVVDHRGLVKNPGA
jgi:phage head maturation protease